MATSQVIWKLSPDEARTIRDALEARADHCAQVAKDTEASAEYRRQLRKEAMELTIILERV
jgi:hypothetical protein